MGVEQNKQKNNSCELFSTLEKSIYFPGELIKGMIILKIHKKINVTSFQVDISQNEYWNWRNGKKTRTSNVKIGNTSVNVGTALQPGEFKFPFSITIPNFIKPSFEYPIKDVSAYIRTFLQISCQDLNISIIHMIIVKKPSTVLNSPLTLTKTHNPKILFIEQGPVMIEASYPANNYSFFNQIPLKISLEWSKSRIHIKKCDISLNRRIKLLDQGTEDKNLIFEDVLWITSKPVSGDKFSFNETFQLCEPQELYNHYSYSSNNLTFPDKSQIIRFIPSTKTGFIDCEYFIVIKASYNTLISIPLLEKPTLIMPLSVTHYSSMDVANSMISMEQQLEQQFKMQNNSGGDMMTPQMQNPSMTMSQQQGMNPYQPNSNMMMSQQQGIIPYQPNSNMMMSQQQGMNPYQPNSNMMMSQQQGMNPYHPNSNMMMSQQQGMDMSIGNQNQKPNNPMQSMNNNFNNTELSDINNYPSSELLDAPPLQNIEQQNPTPENNNNPYPSFN